MTFEVALRKRIKDGLPSGTGATVDWNKRPQGNFPAIVLTTVSLPIGRHMTGSNGSRPQRVQIDVMGLDRPMVTALREIVLQIIDRPALVEGVRMGRAQNVNVTDLSEEEASETVFRDAIDATIWNALET